MRAVECTKNFADKGINFKTGKKYIMAEDTEGNLRSLFGPHVGMSYPIDQIYRPYKGEPLDGKTLVCFRTGGIGDICFLNPVLRYIKKKYPTMKLKVASSCGQSLENVPEIDELYPMPFDSELLETADYHLLFQGIIEGSSEKSKITHAVDMFFSYFSIDSLPIPPEEKIPKLFFNDQELAWLKDTVTKMGIKDDDYVIGFQMETSSPLRNFPKEKMKVVVELLLKEGFKIVLIGIPDHGMLASFYKGNNPNVIPALNFNVRQSMILANRYNMVITPDSFMVQVAGALNKPLIGLYGPFPSEVRMKYFKNAIGLDPKVVCSPCYKHDFRTCIKGFPSPCFTQTTIEDVIQAVDYLRFKETRKHLKCMDNIIRIPNLSEIESYMLSADKGICFFSGHYTHHNIIRVDPNAFVKADIVDLSEEFKRDFYPFVIYMNRFDAKYRGVFENSKRMVRPGGSYIAYMENAPEPFFTELSRDLGNSFNIMFSKFDPVKRTLLIVGKRPL